MLEALLIRDKGSEAIERFWDFQTSLGAIQVNNDHGELLKRSRGSGAIYDWGYVGRSLRLFGDGAWRQEYSPWMDFGESDFDVEAFVYPMERNLWSPIITRVVGGSGFGSQAFSLWNGKVDFYWTTNPNQLGQRVVSNALIPLNVWTKIAARRRGNTVQIFVNDVLDGQGTIGTIGKTLNPLYVGGDGGFDPRFNGDIYIDNLRIVVYR